MPRANNVQLSVRSSYARARAAELSRATGMSATKVVEEALRAYAPPPPRPCATNRCRPDWRAGASCSF